MLKVAAFYYRHEYDLKDLDDLKSLNTTAEELQKGILFLKSSHLPENNKFKNEFLKDVEKVMKKLKRELL